jgi:hypothetical protein
MKPEEDQPKGTMVILITYLVLTLVIWAGVYLLLLQRGGA